MSQTSDAASEMDYRIAKALREANQEIASRAAIESGKYPQKKPKKPRPPRQKGEWSMCWTCRIDYWQELENSPRCHECKDCVEKRRNGGDEIAVLRLLAQEQEEE